jgi:hypothetical protein
MQLEKDLTMIKMEFLTSRKIRSDSVLFVTGLKKKLYWETDRTDPKFDLKVAQKKDKAHISDKGDHKIPSQSVIDKVKPAYNVRDNLLQIFN